MPLDIKESVEEANRIISDRESKLSEKLDQDKEAFKGKLDKLEKAME